MKIFAYFLTVGKKPRRPNPKEHNKTGMVDFAFRSGKSVNTQREAERKLLAYIERMKQNMENYYPVITISICGGDVPEGWINVKRRNARKYDETNGFLCVYQYNVETQEERDLISLRTNGRKTWRDLP